MRSGDRPGVFLWTSSSLHLGYRYSGSWTELHHDGHVLWTVCDGGRNTCWHSVFYLYTIFLCFKKRKQLCTDVSAFVFLRVSWTCGGLVLHGCCWPAPSPSRLHCWSPFSRMFTIWLGWMTFWMCCRACRSARVSSPQCSLYWNIFDVLFVFLLKIFTLLILQLPFALIPILTFTSLKSIMNDFANGL